MYIYYNPYQTGMNHSVISESVRVLNVIAKFSWNSCRTHFIKNFVPIVNQIVVLGGEVEIVITVIFFFFCGKF